MEDVRNEQGQTLSEFLAAYDENKYRRPSCTVDMAVLTLVPLGDGFDIGVLLIRRRNHPWIGGWALPGGFVEMNEELVDAARRELTEETGVEGLPMREFGVFGAVDRDPRTRVISTGFFSIAPLGSISPAAGDDAADAAIFHISAKMEAQCASAETYRIDLVGPKVLTCRAKLVYDELGASPERFHAPGEGGLGGDHDLVLFSALRALSQLPRKRAALFLTRDCPYLIEEALDALDRCLPVIP